MAKNARDVETPRFQAHAVANDHDAVDARRGSEQYQAMNWKLKKCSKAEGLRLSVAFSSSEAAYFTSISVYQRWIESYRSTNILWPNSCSRAHLHLSD